MTTTAKTGRGPSTGAVVEGQLAYNIHQAAAVCGVSEDTLKAAVGSGRLRGKRTGANGGGLYLFSRAQLEAWFAGLDDA